MKANHEQYEVWPFVWTVEDETVVVSKNTASGIISVNCFTYKTFDEAADNAFRMASKQAKATCETAVLRKL